MYTFTNEHELMLKEADQIFAGREANALTDLELLISMLQGQSKSKEKTMMFAKSILCELGDKRSSNLSIDWLKTIGIKQDIAERIMAAVEFSRRFCFADNKKNRSICSPSDIYKEVRHFADRNQEHFIVMALNGAHEVLETFVATIGLVNKTLVHPREVFARPLELRATAIAIAHNHPSGSLDPSADDVNITRRLKSAGDILGIKILDHLVFSDDEFYSFLEHGLMD